MVPNGHLWLVFRACTCCIFPHIFRLFGVGDPKKLFAEIKQRWVCFSLPREWGTAMRFWVSTTLKSPEMFGFLQFSFPNSIGGVFFMFDLKDPQNICPHQSFIYLPRGKHSPRVTQTRKAWNHHFQQRTALTSSNTYFCPITASKTLFWVVTHI